MTSSITSSQGTRASLMDRVRVREPRAWEELVDLYGPLVYQWCLKNLRDEHSAADVTQEVFAAVATSLPQFSLQGSAHPFRRWLWTVTRNKLVDQVRRIGREPIGAGGSSANESLKQIAGCDSLLDDEPTTDAEVRELLARAIRQVESEFEQRTWQAFWRSTVDAIATNVVASELGIQPATVRQARSRVLRRLRAQLAEEIKSDGEK